MTRARRPRAHGSEPDVIEAIRFGNPIEYTAECREVLIGAYYFGDHDLTINELARARELLDDWRERHQEHERRRRFGQ